MGDDADVLLGLSTFLQARWRPCGLGRLLGASQTRNAPATFWEAVVTPVICPISLLEPAMT